MKELTKKDGMAQRLSFSRSIYSHHNLDYSLSLLWCLGVHYRITIFTTKIEMVSDLKVVRLKSLAQLSNWYKSRNLILSGLVPESFQMTSVEYIFKIKL